MTTIEKLNESVQYAHTVASSTTTLFREFLDEFRSHKKTVNDDPMLSETGKNEKIQKIKEEYERKAVELARDLKNEYKKTLSNARDAAEKIVLSDIPKADDRTKNLLAMKSDELKARVLFSTTPAAAVEALDELVSAASEHPELAASMKSEFLQLSQQVVGMTADQNETLSMRKRLGNLYDSLSQNAMTEDARNAAAIIEQADVMKNAELINPLVQKSMIEIGQQARHYVVRPDEYFTRENGDN